MTTISREKRSLYIDLLKRVLLNTIYCDPHCAPWGEPVFSPELRRIGRDWPRDAHTMVGAVRLDNLEDCVRDVVERGVPGDLIETGVWRRLIRSAFLPKRGSTSRATPSWPFRLPRSRSTSSATGFWMRACVFFPGGFAIPCLRRPFSAWL